MIRSKVIRTTYQVYYSERFIYELERVLNENTRDLRGTSERVNQVGVWIEEDNELSTLKGFECAKITNVLNRDNNAFSVLYNYMFRETNINNYRGLLIMYEPRTQFEIENAKLLSMVKLEDGKYYYQFE